MTVSLLGLGLCLRWARLGALVVLVAGAVGALVSWKMLFFPPALLPALLFLWHSHLATAAPRHPVTGNQQLHPGS
jgi:hypothetical protein